MKKSLEELFQTAFCQNKNDKDWQMNRKSLDAYFFQSKEAYQIQKLYAEILANTISIVSLFGKKDVVQLCAFYSYAVKKGFLSRNHKFIYGYPCWELRNLLGVTVSTGVGVCRHLSSDLYTMLEILHFESGLVLMHLDSGNQSLGKLPYQLDESLSYDEYVKNLQLELGLNDSELQDYLNPQYNHLVVQANWQEIPLFLDPLNDSIYLPVDKEQAFSVGSGKIFSYQSLKEFSGYGKTSDPYLLQVLKESYLAQERECIKNEEVFEVLYQANKEFYEELTQKIKEYSRTVGSYQRELKKGLK